MDKILSTEQDLEEWHHTMPKSYPRRRLLPEFDEEVTDNMLLIHGWADHLIDPLEGSTSQKEKIYTLKQRHTGTTKTLLNISSPTAHGDR